MLRDGRQLRKRLQPTTPEISLVKVIQQPRRRTVRDGQQPRRGSHHTQLQPINIFLSVAEGEIPRSGAD